MPNIQLTDDEHADFLVISTYLTEVDAWKPRFGEFPMGHAINGLQRKSSPDSIAYLLDAMNDDDINLQFTVQSANTPAFLNTLTMDNPIELTHKELYDSELYNMLPNRTKATDKRTIKVHMESIGNSYEYLDIRKAFRTLSSYDPTYKLAATSVQVNTKHAVTLFVDKNADIIYVIHNMAHTDKKNYREMALRVIALIPYLLDYTPSFGTDPFLALVSKDKTKLQPLIDQYITKYAAIAKEHRDNAKYNALGQIKLFDINVIQRDITTKRQLIRQQEATIASAYGSIEDLQAKILYAGNNDKDVQELINYIKKYKPNALLAATKQSTSCIDFELAVDHMYFDEGLLNILSKRASHLLYHGTPLGQLMLGIQAGKYDVRWRGALRVDFKNKSVDAQPVHTVTPDYLVNPHTEEYTCLGNNRRQIVKAIENGSYISMFEQLLSTVGNVNLSDGIVTTNALRNIMGAEHNSILDISTNTWMSFKEWKELYYVTT